MLLLLLFVSLSFALDLRTALEKALSSYPELEALREEEKAIRAKALGYREYLNPTLTLEVGNFGTSTESASKNPIRKLSYSQPLLVYPLRELSSKVVDAELSAFEQKVNQAKNRVKAQTYLAFYQALYKRELLRIAEEDYRISEELYRFVKRLYDLGETTKLDYEKAQRELELSKRELEVARLEYEKALAELSLYTNQEVSELEGSLEELRSMEDIQPEQTPQVRYYELATESLRRSVELEKTLAKPQPSVELSAEKVSDYSYGLRFALSSTLPLFYKREVQVLQLTSQMGSLSRLKDLELRKTRLELKKVKKSYELLKEQINRIDQREIPLAKEELALALKSYRLRVITQLELSDVKRRYIQLLRQRAELLFMAHQEYAQYLALGGRL